MATSSPVIPYSAGDRLEEWEVELEGVDLSLFSSIKAFVGLEGGAQLDPNGIDAIIVDAANGKFRIEWPPSGLPEGNHAAIIEFIRLADSKRLTVPTTKNPIRICVGPEKPRA